jgi:hypothetical protein
VTVSFCESSEFGIEMVMDNMGIAETLVTFLQNTSDSELFKYSMRLVGTILTHRTAPEYCETFIKYGLLDAMTIGWNKYGSDY